MRYNQHIAKFVSKLQRQFGQDFFEWIDAPENKDVDLKHMDYSELNKSLFEIDVCIYINDLTENELDEIHNNLIEFSERESIQVDLIETNSDICVYRFSLHAYFLNVEN